MPVKSRPYSDEADYERMRALLVEGASLTGPALYCSVGELDWWRFTEDDPNHISSVQLWLSGESLLGFTYPHGNDEIDLLVHPAHADVLDEMLTWAETRPRPPDAPSTLTVLAFDGDRDRVSILRQRGYARQSQPVQHYHARRLDGEQPRPQLPAGFTIGDLRGATAADIERRVAVHRAAFAPSPMTIAKHCAVMAAPSYRPELDLIAIAPNGDFAAYCLVWFDATNQLGVFEPVGTHPDYQRRGLARALLHEGCRRLTALGAHTACVLSISDNVAASQLYPAAGFPVLDVIHLWTKTLA